MKLSELKQIIKEEIFEVSNKKPNMDMINRELNILDKFIDTVEKSPVIDSKNLIKILRQSIINIRKYS
jgi:hypothetical protein